MQEMVRPEHPRPQFKRDAWICLNGKWQFELDLGKSGRERQWHMREAFEGSIQVPFCPESKLSGVEYTDFIRACWYRREFDVPAEWLSGDILLHFGAVNYDATVWVNGIQVTRHVGGYASFSTNIRRAARPGKNSLVVLACSDVRAGRQPSGKQSQTYASHGCYYTRTTGIWQTVWLEAVPKHYIARVEWTPDVMQGGFHLLAEMPCETSGVLHVHATFKGETVSETSVAVSGRMARGFVKLSRTRLWSPDDPALYDLALTLEAHGEIDHVMSYAGLRQIGWSREGMTLNGRPFYMRLVLDQGFYPDGIITAPNDEALRHDIQISKDMGFNGARLHQKMFEARYLYWADRLGYVVWGEHGNWGMDLRTGENVPAFLQEWLECVRRDISSPALIGWCPLNETQRDTDTDAVSAIYHATRAADPSRPVIDTSGWVHSAYTDVYDYHDYAQDPQILRDNLAVYVSAEEGEPFPKCLMPWMATWRVEDTVSQGQPIFLSEFGGIGWILGEIPENRWGYGNLPESEAAFLDRFERLVTAALETKGICGFCYTQLTDVEQEINGLYTYGRVPKFPAEKIRAILLKPAWNE